LKLLLVDDDPKFRRYMQRGLEESGLDCQVAEDGEQARRLLEGGASFDLVLLDVMLPGSSGWEVLERLRAGGDRTPVIFLTARHSVEERVKGLRLGADDYVIKPFDFGELLARIEAVRRRRELPTELRIGPLQLDLERHVVECRGVRIEMSPREFDLLLCLARAQGRALTRSELLREVWGMDFDPGTNVVNVLVARLRRRLEPWAPGLIRTITGTGYALEAAATGAGPR
jgi:two-component system copper resistance phosphate regulon response regulator CusR